MAKAILEAIKAERFKPGDMLPPMKELCEELQVGISSVREGLKQLQSMGVVKIIQGKGTYLNENLDVRSKTLEDLICRSEVFDQILCEEWYKELVHCSEVMKFTPEQQIMIHLIVSIYKTRPADYQEGRTRFIDIFGETDGPSTPGHIKWVIEMYERQIKRLVAAEDTIMNYGKQSPKKSKSKTRKIKR